MLLINLERYSHLFKDEEAVAAFASVLEQAAKDDDTPLVTFHERHIVTALSPQSTERFLTDRILQRFVEKPSMLEDFVERLKTLDESQLVD